MMMQNNLSQAAPVAGTPQSNPLAANPATPPPQQQAGPQINAEDIPDHIDTGNYVLPMLGKLLSDPKASRKDVIKSVGTAISDDRITAGDAVKFLGTLPDDDAQLRPWLKQKYTHLVAGLVHLNAMNHAQQMQAQPQPQVVQ